MSESISGQCSHSMPPGNSRKANVLLYFWGVYEMGNFARNGLIIVIHQKNHDLGCFN